MARWIRFERGVERRRMDGAGGTVAVTIDGIGTLRNRHEA